MKKFIYLILIILSLAMLLVAGCSCDDGEPEKEYYTITFKQDGYDDVVKTLEKGQTLALTEVPSLQQAKKGHSVKWEEVDFLTITTNTVVNAVETPNTYTVTLQSDWAEDGILFKQVTYGESYILDFKPAKQGYVLNEQNPWIIYNENLPSNSEEKEFLANSGTWNIDSDVILLPNWNVKNVYVTILGLNVENLSNEIKDIAENCTVDSQSGVKIAVPYRSDFSFKNITNSSSLLSCVVDANGNYFSSQKISDVTQEATYKAILFNNESNLRTLTFLEDGVAPVSLSVQNGSSFNGSSLQLPTITATAEENCKLVWCFDKSSAITSSFNVYAESIPVNEVLVFINGLDLPNIPVEIRSNFKKSKQGNAVYTNLPVGTNFANVRFSPIMEDKIFSTFLTADGKYFNQSSVSLTEDIAFSVYFADVITDKVSLTFLEENASPTTLYITAGNSFIQSGLSLPTTSATTPVNTKNTWVIDKTSAVSSSINVYAENIPANNALVFFKGLSLDNLPSEIISNYKQLALFNCVYTDVPVGTSFENIAFLPIISAKSFSTFVNFEGKYFNQSDYLITEDTSFGLFCTDILSGKISLTFLEVGYAPTSVQVDVNSAIDINQIPNVSGNSSSPEKILIWDFDKNQPLTANKNVKVKEISSQLTITYEIDTTKAIPISDVTKLGLVTASNGVYVQTISYGQVENILQNVFIYTHIIDKLVIKGTDTIFDLQTANSIEEDVIVSVVLKEATIQDLYENNENYTENV